MTVTITASGRVYLDTHQDKARKLAALMSEKVLDSVLRFVIDGGRGSVILQAKDGKILGGRIDLVID